MTADDDYLLDILFLLQHTIFITKFRLFFVLGPFSKSPNTDDMMCVEPFAKLNTDEITARPMTVMTSSSKHKLKNLITIRRTPVTRRAGT